ncbi:MAG TPA: sugar phosphate isomerase/epimerase [Verrucomicrobiae bacterium]|nr:sugar phosphate isomerase/epimerase [Verrucomicrobiae bacterium]
MKPRCSILPVLLLTAATLSTASLAADYEPKIGIQTWTLRNMDFDQVVDFCVKHKIKYVQMIGKHMEPSAPMEETKRKKAILDKNGLVCYTFGVAGTSMNKEENRKLFEFAKAMGIKVIVVEPRDMAQWDNLEQLVKEYDIKLAIHNHGIESAYGNPETVRKILNARDKRIGVCLDVGHVTGAGFDAGKVFREYDGRVWDIHLKDKKVETADGKKVILDVEIGTGQANYKGLFAELKQSKWDGVLAIETDNGVFATNPAKYVDGAIQFVQTNKP